MWKVYPLSEVGTDRTLLDEWTEASGKDRARAAIGNQMTKFIIYRIRTRLCSRMNCCT